MTMRLRKEGEDTWVSLEAVGAEGDAKKTAEEITKRAQGWEYKIPNLQGPIHSQAPLRPL